MLLPRIARQGTASLISIRGQARKARIDKFELDEGFQLYHPPFRWYRCLWNKHSSYLWSTSDSPHPPNVNVHGHEQSECNWSVKQTLTFASILASTLKLGERGRDIENTSYVEILLISQTPVGTVVKAKTKLGTHVVVVFWVVNMLQFGISDKQWRRYHQG